MKSIVILLTIILLLNVICPSLVAAEKAFDSITTKSNKLISGKITGYNKQLVYFKSDTGSLYIIEKVNIVDLVATEAVKTKVYSNKVKYPSNHLAYEYFDVPIKEKVKDSVKRSDAVSTVAINNADLIKQAELDSLPPYQRLHIQQLQSINKNVQMIWLTSLLMVIASLATAASLSQ